MCIFDMASGLSLCVTNWLMIVVGTVHQYSTVKTLEVENISKSMPPEICSPTTCWNKDYETAASLILTTYSCAANVTSCIFT